MIVDANCIWCLRRVMVRDKEVVLVCSQELLRERKHFAIVKIAWTLSINIYFVI